MTSLSARSRFKGPLISLLASGAALACSGEGAGRAIATSSLIGLACLAISIAATVFSVVRSRRLLTLVAKREGTVVRFHTTAAGAAVVLLILHPTFWLGVTSGDCGYTLRLAGPIVAALHLGIAGFVMTRKAPPAM